MKLLMLCREPRLYSCQRLTQEAERLGHSMEILDPNKMMLKLHRENSISAGQFAIYYQDQATEPYLLPQYDAVLPRFGCSSTQMGIRVLRQLQLQGLTSLNNADAFLLARDKWQSLQLLLAHHIAVPTSLIAGPEVKVEHCLSQLCPPTILKTLSGSQGIGVMLAPQSQTLVSMLETLNQANIPSLLQNFISTAQNTDIRCFVIGNKVVASMKRISQQGEFRSNFHRGGSAQKIDLTEAEKNLAIKATQALGLDVAGVDLIPSDQGLLVLEVNASPGLEMIEKTSGVNIALEMILYLEQKFNLC